MEYLFVSSGSLAFFIIALILGKKEKEVSDYILCFWLVIFISNFLSLFLLNRDMTQFSLIEMLIFEFSEASIFIHGPLLLVYTYSLTQFNFRITKVHLIHSIPFIATFLLLIFNILNDFETNQIIRDFLLIFKMMSLLTYLIFVIKLLVKHSKNVENVFSNIGEKGLKWLFFLSWSILIIWTIACISLIIDRFTYVSIPQYGGLATNIALSLFVFVMGYFGINQQSIFASEHLKHLKSFRLESTEALDREDTIEFPKYEKSGLDPHTADIIHKKLIDLMKIEKPYLKKELTLFSLSELLNTQPNHLSQVINSIENNNFFDFINSYRVNLAKKKIISEDLKTITLLGIAYDCGFNSKASFNRAFKKFTGKTPSEFKKSKKMSN